MKTRMIIMMTFTIVLISGCLVKSLHPFYKNDDVVFDPRLSGTWLDEDSATWRINPYKFSKGFMKGDSVDNSYLVEMFEDPQEISTFNVHLFQLDNLLYLDFAPIMDDRYENMLDIHMVPSHSIARISFISDNEIQISWFEEEWLDNLFRENKVKISHEVIRSPGDSYSDEYILTASTDELQKFISKYGSDEDAYLCESENNKYLCVRLKRTE